MLKHFEKQTATIGIKPGGIQIEREQCIIGLQCLHQMLNSLITPHLPLQLILSSFPFTNLLPSKSTNRKDQFVFSNLEIQIKVYGPRLFPYSSSLSRQKLLVSFYANQQPYKSVRFFLHIVSALSDELFCTLAIRIFIWVGRRSIPEMVNSRLVVFVLRSLIICPNLPEICDGLPLRVLDSLSSSLFLRYYSSLLLSSIRFQSSRIFIREAFFLSYSSFIFLNFYSWVRCQSSFSIFTRRIYSTRFVFGSITLQTFFGRTPQFKSIF